MDEMHIENTIFFDTQNMEKIGSDTKPLGIGRRLINFVISLLSRSMTPASEEVPEELPSPKNGKSSDMSPNKPNGYSDSEIEVEFRHTTSSKRWKQIDELGELIHSPEKDGLILNHDQAVTHRGFEKKGTTINHLFADIDHSPYKRNVEKTRGKGLPELEPLIMDDGSNDPSKTEIVIEEIIGEDDRNKNKEANTSADEATKSHNQHDEPRPQRRFGPFFSVASNINEKSEAYISSRKKDMHRNYSLDTEKP